MLWHSPHGGTPPTRVAIHGTKSMGDAQDWVGAGGRELGQVGQDTWPRLLLVLRHFVPRRDRPGVRLFEEEDADLTKVAIGHCDSWPMLDYWVRIAERGAYVQLDN